jgi:predicted secreted protein
MDGAYSVVQTSDGGYAVVGNTWSNTPGSGETDYLLVKTDSAGNQQWNKSYGQNSGNQARSVAQTTDGGYIIAGSSDAYEGKYHFWVVKTDSAGNQQWNKTYVGALDREFASSVVQTSDGGFAIVGIEYSNSSAALNAYWLVKTDSSGNEQWNNTYRFGNQLWEFPSVLQTTDGGYVIAGSTSDIPPPNNNLFDSVFWLIKTDSSGTEEWNRTYGVEGSFANSVRQTPDGGYILAGGSPALYGDAEGFCLVKTSSLGNQEWIKTYGGPDPRFAPAEAVQLTSDGGYILAGCTYSQGAGGQDAWVVKTDSMGNQQWNKTFGGINDDTANSVQQASDGGYIVAGTTGSFGAGGDDFWLIKIPQNPDIAPPSTIENLGISSVTDNSITLTWTAPGDGGKDSNATQYVVRYSTTGPITRDSWSQAIPYPQSWTPAKNGTIETHTITGLTPATCYWFAVEACDTDGNYGAISNSPSATTSSDVVGGMPNNGSFAVLAPVILITISLISLTLVPFGVMRRRDRIARALSWTDQPKEGAYRDSAAFSTSIICPECGSLVRNSHTEYCPNCGTYLLASSLGKEVQRHDHPAAAPIGTCIVCNLEISENDQFVRCPYCGNAAHKIHMLEWLHIKGYCPACHNHLDEKNLLDN